MILCSAQLKKTYCLVFQFHTKFIHFLSTSIFFRDLAQNYLTGPLPSFIGELTNLQYMWDSQLKTWLHQMISTFISWHLISRFLSSTYKVLWYQCIIWTCTKGDWESYESCNPVRYIFITLWLYFIILTLELNSGWRVAMLMAFMLFRI